MATVEFLIAAAHKSSGKTTLSIGLARALRDRGMEVQTFKKGPDYIDPMWLAAASGAPCYNLDFNVQARDEILSTFKQPHGMVKLVEGNKGLYDSIDVAGKQSNAELARLLELPVILVINTEGITRGIAPLLQGYLGFEDLDFRGVVLNRTASSRHEGKLRQAVEMYTDLKVLGCVGRFEEMEIVERHLGLIPGNEHTAREFRIESIAAVVKQGIDLDQLVESATVTRDDTKASENKTTPNPDLVIGVARDEAFGFYYPDDLETFARYGATLKPFSPIHDRAPPDAHALFLGGGFPENFAAALSANDSMRESIRAFAAEGGVIYAECGGLMYLSNSLGTGDGEFDMCNVLPVKTRMHTRPVGRGLVRLAWETGHPWADAGPIEFRAHEFHYSDVEGNTRDMNFGFKVLRGHGVNGHNDGIIAGNVFASYVHQRHTRQNPWIQHFTQFIRNQPEYPRCP